MKITYINLLNGYYNSPVFAACTLSCHSLIMALIKKANNLGFRQTFTATNHEMQHLSKIEAISTFCRVRNEMLKLEVDGRFVFSYKNGKRGSSCGEYTIDYDLLLDYSQSFRNNENEVGIEWESSENEVGTLIDKNRSEEIRKDPPDYPIDGYIPGGRKTKGSLKGRSKEEIDFLWEGFEYYGYTRQKYDSELARYGYEFMDECLNACIDQEEKGKEMDNPQAYLGSIVRNKWMEKGNG